MKIGMDISIAECRRSGYLVMEFKKRDLIKKGKLNKNCYVMFSASFPMAWNDAGKPMLNSGYDLWSLEPTSVCWNDLIDIIEDKKQRDSIASTCDWENCQPNLDNPNEYDMLHLASDINCCCSLE